MDIQRQFPGVRWIGGGAISFVYEVHPSIVVKAPKRGEYERVQFRKELEIYEIFSQHPPSPFLVQSLFYSNNGIFLEYVNGTSLFSRIESHHIRDPQTMIVTKVELLEPLLLRKEWMNDLAQAVAFLESLNLAHGDLRPENILLDCDRLKLCDFDCTDKFGADFETCMAPYGRILNSDEADHGRRGTSGFLGPRTEQFALGSLFYLINYGFEVYGDRCLTEDPHEHGPMVVDLLQNMVFPKLNGDPLIDDIIDKCWHNKFVTIAELATEIKGILTEGTRVQEKVAKSISITRCAMDIGHFIRGLCCNLGDWRIFLRQSTNKVTNTTPANDKKLNGDRCDGANQDYSAEVYLLSRKLCQDLEKDGLLLLLSSGEPEQLGFTFQWERHLS